MTATCPTCWFANGDGVSRHCGHCACCPDSARIAARARKRTYVLTKVRDLTPEEEREVEALIESDQRLREEEERTRYESHAWGGGDDGDECVACGVRWEDCEAECFG